jgi:general secretion pathway protein N
MKMRRATLIGWLGCAILGSLAFVILDGYGSDPQWREPLPAAAAAANTHAAPLLSMDELPEQRLAAIWQQPLFSPDRHPDAERSQGAETGLAGYALSGVVLDGAARWALLRQGQRPLKLKLGQALDNGWVLSQLSARQASFSYQGQTRQLRIPILRLPPPETADDAPRLPAPSVMHTDAPQEAEPPVTAP